jgi:hypothetical protein
MRIFSGVLAVLAAVSLWGIADAKVKIKKVCGPDLERFCKDVKKGEGRKACLAGHASELQPVCRDALKARIAGKAEKA